MSSGSSRGSSDGRSSSSASNNGGNRGDGRSGSRSHANGRSTSASGRSNSNGRSQSAQGGRNGGHQGRENEGLMKLFNHQLMDLYYVEKQLLKALPRMADKAMSDQLSEAFLDHAQETEAQVDRLERIFDELGRTARGKRCEAIDGILEEAKDLMDEFKDDNALDAALVCAAQKVEHYEITTYGSLCAFAEELGMDEVCELLEQTLEEEKGADEKLSQLAESALNSAGMRGEGEDEEEDEDDERDTEASDTEEEDEEVNEDDEEEGAAQDRDGKGSRRRYANA